MAHGTRGCENHADSLTCSPGAASYQTSDCSHTAASVVGHGMLIQGLEGLMYAKPGPVTEICFVCSASAAMRAQPRSEPPAMYSVMVGPPEACRKS